MPDAQILRKADGFLTPRHYPPGVDDRRRPQAFKALFTRSLESKQAWYRQVHGELANLVTATGDANDANLYFPHGHPTAGQDRYEWFVAEQGADGLWRPVAPCEAFDEGINDRVRIGYLVDDPHEDDPEAQRRISEETDRKIEEHRADPRYIARMIALGIYHEDALQLLPEGAMEAAATALAVMRAEAAEPA